MRQAYITQDELRMILATSCSKHGSQKRISITLGISESYLSEILSGKDISEKVANRMGFTLSKMYLPINEVYRETDS